MTHVYGYQLRNGRFGRQVIVEPLQESDVETESGDEAAIANETVSSSDDELSLSEADEGNSVGNSSSESAVIRWGKCVIPEPNASYRGSFKEIDGEIHQPISYFRRIFDENISRHIVEQTNIYSVQQQQKSVATNCAEIDRYLGILLQMAIIPMPRYRMFWEKNTVGQ